MTPAGRTQASVMANTSATSGKGLATIVVVSALTVYLLARSGVLAKA